MGDRFAPNLDGVGVGQGFFTGNHAEKFALSIAGDARHTDDLAGPDIETDIRQCDRERCCRSKSDAVEREQHFLAFRRRRFLADFGNRGPDHQAGKRSRRLLARVAFTDHLAVTQDGRAVAQSFDLFQPVTDVEDRLAFRFQPFQRYEQIVRFLRRQH